MSHCLALDSSHAVEARYASEGPVAMAAQVHCYQPARLAHASSRATHPLARRVITHARACQVVSSLGTAETWIRAVNGKGRRVASPATWRGVVGTVEGSAALCASKDACFGAAATPLPTGRSVWLSSPQTECETRPELRLQQHPAVRSELHMVTGHRPVAAYQLSCGRPALICRSPCDVAWIGGPVACARGRGVGSTRG